MKHNKHNLKTGEFAVLDGMYAVQVLEFTPNEMFARVGDTSRIEDSWQVMTNRLTPYKAMQKQDSKKAREYNSPMLQELLDEVTPEEMEQVKINMSKQQTVVEWLIDWMGKNQYFIGNDLLQAVEQAKEMEKQQMKAAVMNNVTTFSPIRKVFEEQFEQYYNETYGK